MNFANFINCCGIHVIHSMDSIYTPGSFNCTQSLTRLKDGNPNTLKLIAINGEQNQRWGAYLIEQGFRCMSHHINGGHDTDNYLYGYHYRDFDNYGEVVTVDGRPEIRLVEAEIYANLRESGRRGPFSALEEAKTAYPRCRRFDRREIMSDGSSQWNNDIAVATV